MLAGESLMIQTWLPIAVGILSGLVSPATLAAETALEKIQDCELGDSSGLTPQAAASEKIQVLSISKLVGEAIIRSYRGDSVTSLFV